ncbi:MAG: hypothetical protein ACI3X8_08435 [Alloprevotella sp.]
MEVTTEYLEVAAILKYWYLSDALNVYVAVELAAVELLLVVGLAVEPTVSVEELISCFTTILVIAPGIAVLFHRAFDAPLPIWIPPLLL